MALIIFDYDGILADTLEDLIRFGQEVCNQLGVHHLVTKEDLSNLEVMSFSSFGRACEVPEPLVDEFVKISLSLFAEKESPPAIFEGLNKVIQRLSANHTIAIVTTNSSQNVHAFLVKHGLDRLVHAVYGIDTPGSKAEKISTTKSLLLENGEQEEVFMIGDSSSDVRAAKEAGVTTEALFTGHRVRGLGGASRQAGALELGHGDVLDALLIDRKVHETVANVGARPRREQAQDTVRLGGCRLAGIAKSRRPARKRPPGPTCAA